MALAVAVLLGTGCNGGAAGTGGRFQLVEFFDSGKNELPRNRTLFFGFSAPLLTPQDFPERLKIENVEAAVGQSNFSKAIGVYIIVGDRVTFLPRLPTKIDRSDAGFRENGHYHVFLKSGPDSLVSADGERLVVPQEFLFDTNKFFDDLIPAEPPRVMKFEAYDPILATAKDLSRLSPSRGQVALMDSKTLLDADRFIDPGAGGAVPYATPWEFRLRMSEPLDPSTVDTTNVQMFEVYSDATQSGDTDPTATATMGHYGTLVSYSVPITVGLRQEYDALGNLEVFVVVRALGTLVDDTRYRIIFSGEILGLDFRKVFIGDNGLTGDGQSTLAGAGIVPEPGGLGYVTEFIVRDRPTVEGTRILTYNPLEDGIQPEAGQTTIDDTLFNTALYNAPANPGAAVGFIGAFGTGKLGDLNANVGTFTLDTGDTPNELAEFNLTVTDADPTDAYKNTAGLPTPGPRTYDVMMPTIFDYKSITIGPTATLKIVGVNPCRILATGLVAVNGIIDAAGSAGVNGDLPPPSYPQGGVGKDAPGGAPGPGGYAGGDGLHGLLGSTTTSYGGCNSYDTYVASAGGRPTAFPLSKHGNGPGRGFAGGEEFHVNQQSSASIGTVQPTGGGGGSHGTAGTFGEDRYNGGSGGSVGSPIGSFGKCSQWGIAPSGVIGLRGAPGTTYGDREALDFVGGSGGGAGGALSGWNHSQNDVGSGGGGGGGGGFLEIISSATIVVTGTVTVEGGAGGAGDFWTSTSQSWNDTTGGGGGGSGGTISIIAAEQVDLSGGMVTAAGGVGGPRATTVSPFTGSCNACNAGGDGGKGFIFLMDADGTIPGIDPGPVVVGQPGNYNNYANGIVSIRGFDANRFGGVNAITELFPARVANPHYLPMLATDILAVVAPTQTIAVKMSSVRPDPTNPLLPDFTSPEMLIDVATVSSGPSGSVVTVAAKPGGGPGSITELLNPSGTPMRDAYLRVVAIFNYSDAKQAALGPYMEMQQVTIRFDFN